MSEKELVEQLKQIILHAEQEAMKESLNAKGEHESTIKAKATGVLALCQLMRETIADYDDGVKDKAAVSETPLANLYMPAAIQK